MDLGTLLPVSRAFLCPERVRKDAQESTEREDREDTPRGIRATVWPRLLPKPGRQAGGVERTWAFVQHQQIVGSSPGSSCEPQFPYL